ncbi:hypothetical protein SAMN05428996_1506 [Quadrisphaera sp. DSM 44207]|nr:hypothetical protein SAMN05428996_1506 [Quadrisphaera sp. DSM 44207]
MRVGIPRELEDQERRVAAPPAQGAEPVARGLRRAGRVLS